VTSWRLVDAGDHRLLTVEGREHRTHYSERVVRLLIERKGPERAPLYFPFRTTRAPYFLDPLFAWVGARRLRDLRVLEIGCSFGHMTEYLAERPEVAAIHTFDTDPAFVSIVRAKVEEHDLDAVREVACLDGGETRRLPWKDAAFDLVLAVGVVEHLPTRWRREQVDEYYRVLAPGGHIAILDTPNRLFPLETHSIGLPLVQWMPPRLAWRYARLFRRRIYGAVGYDEFTADGTGWRNATLAECLPSSGWTGIEDVTEPAGYGWRFFRSTARSPRRRAAAAVLAPLARALAAAGRSPSLCLPYLNLLFRAGR
jgi:SAM-dependent methyltransferase